MTFVSRKNNARKRDIVFNDKYKIYFWFISENNSVEYQSLHKRYLNKSYNFYFDKVKYAVDRVTVVCRLNREVLTKKIESKLHWNLKAILNLVTLE